MGKARNRRKKNMRSIQELSMLSLITGCISSMRKQNAFARIDMRELLDSTYELSEQVIAMWPVKGDETKLFEQVAIRVAAKWHPFIMDDNVRYSPDILITICERIVADLRTRSTDKFRNALLEELRVPIAKIHDYVDPEGRNIAAYSKCDYALDELYRIIDWRW